MGQLMDVEWTSFCLMFKNKDDYIVIKYHITTSTKLPTYKSGIYTNSVNSVNRVKSVNSANSVNDVNNFLSASNVNNVNIFNNQHCD